MKTNVLLLSAIFFLGIGCATTSAPSGVLKSPEYESQDVFGGWIEVDTFEGEKINGELLAVEPDSLFIIMNDNTFIGLPKGDVTYAKLTGYSMQKELATLAVFMGSLSTVSHGFYLAFTFPMWIFAGTISATAHTKNPQIAYKSLSNWQELQTFARYPQGMPNIDRSRLKAYGGELGHSRSSDKEQSTNEGNGDKGHTK